MASHGKIALALTSFACGIFVGYQFSYASEVAIVALILFLTQAIIIFIAKKKNIFSSVAVATAIVSLSLCVAIVRVQSTHDKQPFVCLEVCSVQGEIIREPEMRDTYQRVIVALDTKHAYVEVYAPLYPRFSVGSTVEVTGTIKEPEVLFPHEGQKSFDYVSYLRNKNIGSQMLYPKVVVVSETAYSFGAKLKHVKSVLTDNLNKHIRYPASTIASGILFGANDIPKDLHEIFRITGVSHIVVLSGFNIAIIVSFVLLVLRYVPLIFRISIALLFVLMFVVMVGGEASVIRATLMAIISLLAVAIGRQYIAKQALLVSLFVITMYDPYALLHDVSLHLSFIATAGIIYLGEIFSRLLDKFRLPNFFRDILSTTIAAYIATLPYQMYVFGQVSLYALFTNMIIVPLVPVAMFLSGVTILVSYLSTALPLFFGTVTSLFIDGMISFASFISVLPFSSVGFQISFFGMVTLYVILVTLIRLLSLSRDKSTLSASGVTRDETIYRF
ncbi:MAG: Competence protein [Patescibacteria group bacterium]|nr:Competence protein [Patescibacteria group bacterium]